MAVVQISKIQVRRGQKLSGSGLPQLASGEIGWAIDTREMFIGNGSVAEGAPAVGNTKILTEYDDIFNLADSYTYKLNDSYIETGVNSSNPVRRTLQDRLDDRVSIRSFGAKGDGVTDDTVAIQRAIDQLYINSANKGSVQSRVTLNFEAGTYLISSTLYLPPYATLIGAGSNKTVIKQTGAGTQVFRTVNSLSTPGNPADDSSTEYANQTKDIVLKGMTLQMMVDGRALMLQNSLGGTFEDVSFVGIWTSSDAIEKSSIAVDMNSLSSAVGCYNNKFINCNFSNFGYAVISNWDIADNSWKNCLFDNLGWGIVFGEDMILGSSGQLTGPVQNTIRNSKFTDINRQAIWVVNGERNVSSNNKFIRVGNDSGNDLNPKYSIIKYAKSTNKSYNDFFSRTAALSVGPGLTNIPYIPEIEGTAFYSLENEIITDFGQITEIRVFRLPEVRNQSYDINYTLVSSNYNAVRIGVLTVLVNSYDGTVQLSDQYDYMGDAEFEEAIVFTAALRNADSGDGSLTDETIDVIVTSSMPSADSTQLKYTVHAKKTDIG